MDLQLLFWLFVHPRLFEKIKFQIWEIQMYFSLVKLIQIKKCSTTKLSNFWRSTTFILVICSSDIVVVMLFTNLIYLSSSFMKLYERCRFCEHRYYRFVEWRNDQNKSCRSWQVIQLCSWKLFHLNSFRLPKLRLNFSNLKFKFCKWPRMEKLKTSKL